ncbi:MAG TPA: DUF4347 domain-containing protein, partial [Hyphomicrobiaceae bacterium]|nr:DUF4347 domain-containing protein [Hyphomicrobiaceae bacterium]
MKNYSWKTIRDFAVRSATPPRLAKGHAAHASGVERAASKVRAMDFAGVEHRVAELELIALEPRIVFDGAAIATADAAADQVAQQQADAEASGDQSTTTSEAASDTPVSSFDDSTAAASDPIAFSVEDTSALAPSRQIAFVDGSVENVSELIAALPTNIEIVVLDASRDGVEQIAGALQGQSNIAAIHILSHGSEGALRLGSATLDVVTMQGEYLDELTTIGNSLSAEADILIYGCDFTAGDRGLEAAIVLGGITGADIAASIDATGSADQSGDWNLETQVGAIDSATLSATSWSGLLAAPAAHNDGPVSMIGGVTQDINVLANDTDADGDTLTITGIKDPAYPSSPATSITTGQTVTLASGTTVKLNADKTLAVTLHPDVTGQEVFQYTISDGTGNVAIASVILIRDTDRDGIMDSIDTDADNDGISNVNEGLVASRVDFAAAAGLTASTGQTVTQTYATTNPDVTFDLTFQVQQGQVTAFAPPGSTFSERSPDGDRSSIVFSQTGMTSTSQHNTVTIKFNHAVQNVSFVIADIDGGNGISNESVTFIGKLNGVTRILTPWEVTALLDVQPTQYGNTFVGTSADSANSFRLTFKETIDELQIISGISSNDVNTSAVHTMFDMTFDYNKAGDSDGDGLADYQDLDSDNDGISDTNETIKRDGLSAATAFQDLGMAGTVSTAGTYYFNIAGQAFSTYVDANGYILAAIDFGDGSGSLPQLSNLTNVSRGILTPTALSALGGATEIRISSTNGVINATSNNVDLIYRVAHNITLKYQGTNDNFMNDYWTGTGAQYLTGDGSTSSLGSTLNTNIFHASGNAATLMWVPGSNYQRTIFTSGEIPANEAIYLWVKAPTSSTRVDIDSDGDGKSNRVDIDSDNDGITDTNETINLDGQSAATAFLDLGMAGSVTTAGIYNFNINGQAFSTYVDANGYILVAIDFGDGVGALPQLSNLTNASRGILTPTALLSLDGAKELRISSTNGV